MRLDCRTTPLQIHHSCDNLRILAFLVDQMGQLVVLKVDHLEGLMEGRWEDQKVVLMEGRLVDLMVVLMVVRKVDHLGDLMEGRLVDRTVNHLGVLRGPAVAKEVSLLYERLVLLEPVQVVQLVVKEEMEQARIVPA